MAEWNGRRKSPRVTQRVRGYTLRGRTGRITYVGISNDPDRRAGEHGMDGKRGRLSGRDVGHVEVGSPAVGSRATGRVSPEPFREESAL